MNRRFLCGLAALLFLASNLPAQTRDEKVRGDRREIEGDGHWIYNDLNAAFAQAKESGKPLLVVFRCVPCEACAQIDADVAERDPVVRPLLEQFVCVRIVQTNGMDLSLFQFDYDQSWAAFFMNADKTIYGRYGTRSHQHESENDVSLEGFAEAMKLALKLHQQRDQYADALQAKRGAPSKFPVPEELPMLKGKFGSKLDWEGKVAQSCIHCHQVGESLRHLYRSQDKPIPETVLFPYPHPKILGLVIDPKTATTIKEVTSGSSAERDGFQAGDHLLSLSGQPLVSMADIQWVLHHAGETDELSAKVLRDGNEKELVLRLDSEWRRKGDIAWRATSWDLRRMATGGILFKELTDEEREKARVEPGKLALKAQHVGQYGEHAAAKNAGFRKDDILVKIDGRSDDMRDTDLLAWLVSRGKRGDQVPATILREGKEIDLKLPLQ